MLAYVFWHWPQPATEPADYESRLINFQEALAANRSSGLEDSAVFRVKGAAWVAGGQGYEEWYLLSGSAGLDPLNEMAVAPACRAAHDAAARQAAGGTAGLYRLRLGEAGLERPRFGYWMSKPKGMRYDDFYLRLERLAESASAALWGRQMVLGPTPEFCLRAAEPLSLPASLPALTTQLEPLWP